MKDWVEDYKLLNLKIVTINYTISNVITLRKLSLKSGSRSYLRLLLFFYLIISWWLFKFNQAWTEILHIVLSTLKETHSILYGSRNFSTSSIQELIPEVSFLHDECNDRVISYSL